MKIFKNIKNGKMYIIVRNIIRRCICGCCGGKYTAIEYPKWFGSNSVEIDSLDDFKEVGER